MHSDHIVEIQTTDEVRSIETISLDTDGGSPETPSVNEADEIIYLEVSRSILKEFCADTTVHGIRYFTEPKRHWVERLFWAIAFISSVILCTYAILSLWTIWHERPVLVSFNDKTTSIGMIPFPAVTICSTKKFLKTNINMSAFENLIPILFTNPTDYLNWSPQMLNQFDALHQLCYGTPIDFKNDTIQRTESIYNTIKNIAPEMTETIFNSAFMNQFHDLFNPIFTGQGLCSTFNSLNSRDIFTDEIRSELLTVIDAPNAINWNIENGYKSNIKNTYPYRVFGRGVPETLSVSLILLIDDSYDKCNEFSRGFRLSLHSPDELPLSDDFIYIAMDQDAYVSVKPNVIWTSNGLRNYLPKERGCYFKSERQLRFFKMYNQRMCELECLTNFTKNSCGCVKFSMPSDNNTKICTMIEHACYYDAGDIFSKNFLIQNCNCLPDCTSITYDMDVSQIQYSPIDRKPVKEMLKKSPNDTYRALSRLSISFKQSQFIAMNRTETYSMTDFVAGCGGLLGLFMGISLLSIVEMIYYFTLRLLCMMRQQNTRSSSDLTWARRVSIQNKRF